MILKTSIACLGLLSASAALADNHVVPEPAAPIAQAKSGAAPAFKPRPLLRLAAPTISQTRLVRQPDGSVRMQCDQIANPRAKATLPVRATTTPEISQ